MGNITNKIEKIIFLFELVRDIPYGNIGKRKILEVLEQKRGSCSGKHLLLGKLYELLGLKVKYMMGKTNLKNFNKLIPEKLCLKEDVFDYHNYIKVYINNKWLVVDATFDSALKCLGFPVNDKWFADRDCQLAFETIDNNEVVDLSDAKIKALSGLTKAQRIKRYNFFQNFISWLERIRY